MRIALFLQHLNKFSETWIADQIDYLREHICIIVVQTPSSVEKFKGIKVVSVVPPAASVWQRGLRRLQGNTKNSHGLSRGLDVVSEEIGKSAPDLIYIHFLNTAYELRPVLERFHLPIYVHCHGYDVTWDLRSHEEPERNIHPADYLDFVREWSSKLEFVANSNSTKTRLLKQGVPEQRISVNYFGVDTDKYTQKTKPKDVFKILYVGRLIDCKGADLLIKAYEIACDKGMKAELHIIGNGQLLTTCQLLCARSKQKESIKLMGALGSEEVRQLMLESSIFSMHNQKGELSHQEEAFGVAILEAMACGLPVVTGRSGGVVEIVEEGKTGYLVEPGNVEEHAERFLELYKDEELRRRMGTAGRARVKESFTKEKEKQGLLHLLESRIIHA